MIADYEPKERMPLILKGYSIKDRHYDHYDNYDAINVDKCSEIPIDYDGVIGVPITILNYLLEDGFIHCVVDDKMKKATPKSDFYLDNVKKNLIFLSGKQFEIVGNADDKDYYPIVFGYYDRRITINGKQPFKRIFIKKVS